MKLSNKIEGTLSSLKDCIYALEGIYVLASQLDNGHADDIAYDHFISLLSTIVVPMKTYFDELEDILNHHEEND